MLLIIHGSLILWEPCCACKGEFLHTLTLIWLLAPRKENSLSSMLFLGPSTRLGIQSSTNQQESFLFISVNLRLNNCTKGWVISPMYYVSYCVFYCGLKKTSKTRRINRQSTMCPFCELQKKHQPLPANKLLAFWKVHCMGNKIVTIAYAAGCCGYYCCSCLPFTWHSRD